MGKSIEVPLASDSFELPKMGVGVAPMNPQGTFSRFFIVNYFSTNDVVGVDVFKVHSESSGIDHRKFGFWARIASFAIVSSALIGGVGRRDVHSPSLLLGT